MEIYAKLTIIAEETFSPITTCFAKNDSDVFVYFQTTYTREFVEDMKAQTLLDEKDILTDDFFLNNIRGNMIHLLTVEKAKDFLEKYKISMEKECFNFLTSFIRKDKIKNIIKNILEDYGTDG